MQHLKDLKHLMHIMRTLCERYAKAQQTVPTVEQEAEDAHYGSALMYGECALQLLSTMGTPFLAEETSEEEQLAPVVAAALSDFGTHLLFWMMNYCTTDRLPLSVDYLCFFSTQNNAIIISSFREFITSYG